MARAGMFDTEIFYTLGIVDIPLLTIGNDESQMGEVAIFGSVGTPFPNLQKVTKTGGQGITILYIIIQADGQVHVDSSIDFATGKWVPFAINKLPQQYIINVTEGTDGTMAADWTYDEIQETLGAYQTDKSGTAVFGVAFEGCLYRMVAGDNKSVVFSDTTPEGISTLTLSQKDGKDVWTHEVVPLSVDNSFRVTLTSKVSGGYDIDKTLNEVVKAYNDNKYIYALFQNKNDFEFLSLDKFLVPGVEGYSLIAFSNEHRCIVFRSSGGSVLMYDKSRSSDMTVLRRGDAMPPVPVTAADNGKFLRVVDGQWAAEAVGGETWEKIAEIVIPEGADETTALTISKDSDGNPFSLVKARLCAKFPKYTGTTTIPNFSFAMLNGKTTGRVTPLAYTSVWPKVSASIITGTVYEIDVSGAQQIEHVTRSGNGGWTDDSSRDYAVYGALSDTDTTWFGDTLWAKPITSIGGTGMLIYPGCRFVLYGVRA